MERTPGRNWSWFFRYCFFLNHCFRIPSVFWKFDCFLILKPLKTMLTFSRLNIAVAHWSSIQICSNYWARELKLREFAKLSIFFFFYFYPPTHYCITCICIIVDWIFLNTVKYVIKRFFLKKLMIVNCSCSNSESHIDMLNKYQNHLSIISLL